MMVIQTARGGRLDLASIAIAVIPFNQYTTPTIIRSMKTITFSTSRDHGHYYGRPGFQISITDGAIAATPNEDLNEIIRLADLQKNGIDVAGGDVMESITSEAIADLTLLKTRITAAIASSGTLTVFDGKPYVYWTLPLGSPILANFLDRGLDCDNPAELLTELRSRHSFETPLEFNSGGGWTYTTWSRTTVRQSDDVDQYGDRIKDCDRMITVAIPLDRVIHEDGEKGFHFQLLAS